MQSGTHPFLGSDELIVWVERGLALRSGTVDPTEVQRQLKHLRRLEPSARSAVAMAGVAARADLPVQDFDTCLRGLS